MRRYLLTIALLLLTIASAQADPCQHTGSAHRSISIGTAASSLELVPAVAGQVIFVCQYSWSNSSAGSASLAYGTGTNCGTGTTFVTGYYVGNVSVGWGGVIAQTPIANALCVAAGGTTPSVNGVLTYVQEKP
jgi:hypothetical protein